MIKPNAILAEEREGWHGQLLLLLFIYYATKAAQ